MLRSHLVRANWSNLAVIFDGEHQVVHSVNLNQFSEGHFDLFRFALAVSLFLAFLSFFAFSLLFSRWLLAISLALSWLFKPSVRYSNKERLVSFDKFFVLAVELWHLGKVKIGRSAPVELLGWELELP